MYNVKALVPTTKHSVAELEKRLDRALDTTASDVNRRYAAAIRQWRTPVTFATETPTTNERTITTQSDIFLYNDEGTRPHRINPRRKRFLHFYWRRQGRWVFSKGVNHPGTKAKKITHGIAVAIQSVLESNIQSAITEV